MTATDFDKKTKNCYFETSCCHEIFGGHREVRNATGWHDEEGSCLPVAARLAWMELELARVADLPVKDPAPALDYPVALHFRSS